MTELVYIIGVAMLIALTLKCIYIKTTTKEERKENINLMSEIVNYDDYIRIYNDIAEGEL